MAAERTERSFCIDDTSAAVLLMSYRPANRRALVRPILVSVYCILKQMELAKIRKSVPLREQAYESLKEAILSGRMQPGERLTEEGVAEFLGVSRTPAREALGLLVNEGVVNRREAGGYLIPVPSLAKVEEIYEVRRQLEPLAARLAATRVTQTQMEELRAAIDAEREIVDTAETGEFMAANRRFRNLLCAASGNEQLIKCIDCYADHLQFVGSLTLTEPNTRRIAINCHERIYEALSRNDPGAAEDAVLDQIYAATHAMTTALERDEQATPKAP